MVEENLFVPQRAKPHGPTHVTGPYAGQTWLRELLAPRASRCWQTRACVSPVTTAAGALLLRLQLLLLFVGVASLHTQQRAPPPSTYSTKPRARITRNTHEIPKHGEYPTSTALGLARGRGFLFDQQPTCHKTPRNVVNHRLRPPHANGPENFLGYF